MYEISFIHIDTFHPICYAPLITVSIQEVTMFALQKLTANDPAILTRLCELIDAAFQFSRDTCPPECEGMYIPEGKEIYEHHELGHDIQLILKDGTLIGGAVVAIEQDTGYHTLELLFIDPAEEGKGYGAKAWFLLENAYPEAAVWGLATPPYLKGNLHFYVNKCGFAITRFYHAGNPKPSPEGGPAIDYNDLFWFEKKMK